jgi:hypothetical protein
MPYFLYGLMALLLAVLALHAFARANTVVLARNVRIGTAVAALGGAFVLLVRGAVSLALPLAVFGSWLLWGQPGRGSWPRGAGPSGQSATSRVVTEHLEMELEHATGSMQGRIRKGRFAGRELSSLRPINLAQLWRDWRFSDPQSAQLVEAWLDRTHPEWREDVKRSDAASDGGAAAKSGMTLEEALDLLGLDDSADAEDVRRAHRALMLKLHPDRGGSTYLAAKINEAKDLALSHLERK